MKGLTVIATNNGFDYLEEALASEQKFGKWPVLVVDTCSDAPTFSLWAQMICENYGAEYVRMDTPRYDFGAYMWAYKNKLEYDAFWFKHDSLYLKDPKFYSIVEDLLEKFNYDLVGWHFFAKWGSSFDNEDQRKWLEHVLGSDYYDYGFYGPNLAVKRETLDKLAQDLQHVIVDDKIKQQGMERGWAILGHKHKMKMLFLENFKGDVKSDAYRFFKKATHTSGAPRQ